MRALSISLCLKGNLLQSFDDIILVKQLVILNVPLTGFEFDQATLPLCSRGHDPHRPIRILATTKLALRAFLSSVASRVKRFCLRLLRPRFINHAAEFICE
jgi:hypothetical protein